MTAEKSGAEPRRFTRIHFDARTEILCAGQKLEVQLIDISFKGLLLKSSRQLLSSPGEQLNVQIHIGEHLLNLPVELAHTHNDLYGFRLKELSIDNATHLHRLVELNLGDEALFERELEHLMPGMES